MSKTGTPVDRSAHAGRFSKLSPESRPTMPEGYSAPLELKTSRQRMREAQEALREKP